MPWVYILKCSDGSYYTGSTMNLSRRVSEHNQGLGSKWICRRLPVKLVFAEEMPNIVDAYFIEHKIKKWSRAKKEALIAGDWDLLRYFAKKPKFRRKTIND